MNHKKQNLLLAAPLLALGVAVVLSWLRGHRRERKAAYAA